MDQILRDTVIAQIEASRKKQMPPLYPAIELYRALLNKDLCVACGPTHAKLHDAEKARQWLGSSLAATYLEKAPQNRWPQEGLTANDIADLFKSV